VRSVDRDFGRWASFGLARAENLVGLSPRS
jgi:hypothetical protein